MTPDQLKAWRVRLGLTQAEGARQLGFHSNHFALMERGERKIRPIVEIACKQIEAEKSTRLNQD